MFFLFIFIVITRELYSMDFQLNELTPDEKRIILNKGTEAPFSGKYNDFFESGIYSCRHCGQGLYYSKDKFKSGCGWPAFDDEIPGAISKNTDSNDGRVEITCSRCGGHLGHLFKGEELTPKNLRYCVNSISLDLVPEKNIEKAYFAGGCFWGMEYFFSKQYGVLHVMPGYMGGQLKNPSYKEVCSGKSGHAETIMILYDKTKVDFETLAKLFFEIHDPTQVNRQGPDVGTQYRSAIFYSSEKQKDIAERLIKFLKEKGLNVVTELHTLSEFYPAEEYHRKYYLKSGKEPYCHVRIKRF